jgi:hypothetical protein
MLRYLCKATTLAIIALGIAAITQTASLAESGNIPVRSGPVPLTTNGVPHVQIGVTPVPELSVEFLRRVAKLPGVEIRDTVVSLPGAKGFWITQEVSLARPDVIVGGREFGHMHPDGSLHASLSPEFAVKVVKAGWAIAHPWAKKREGWEGFVMIYTPGSKTELEVVLQLVLESYGFVTGQDVASIKL